MRRSGAPSQKRPVFGSSFCPPTLSTTVANKDINRSPQREPLHSISNTGNNSQPTEDSNSEAVAFRYFSCVWAKKSARKHKKWEGDALIKVR